ncbi:molybdopterin guanine dinucleotide-containing S/N-oxide reductase [Mesorhizobium sp. BAC0120]|uniref:molybdopterin guanine dinucleotide-containing S/N-oxide reductase n=1 Tax=Mesorhizobium sp. BAC0120 TaxID=3090670 RepID=UPI00298C22D4|nr:molybdopterin guanine dinucleotide-containing S/N-oxide reductase [Mesorhizobium sp. BAC0120]MDW6023386.1 molybdopterin guanine dinucleotide-containing S/N-oxide reductase [Mesorhizobium sp. BAC0120]
MANRVTLTHWGAYRPEVRDGRLVAMMPHPEDQSPSPIGRSIPGTLDDTVRIPQPMVRAGFLAEGAASRDRRGAEPFVPVDWETATGLAARELERVRRDHGNRAIFGGSYGWASAGRFHHAQSQLHRFLNVAGGYTRSVNTHSHAAAEVLLPHLIGSHHGMGERHTPWELIRDHTRLFVAFGGLPVKNAQVSAGGVSRHRVPDWLRECRRSGTAFVNVSPLCSDMEPELDAQWVALRPNTDTALMLGLAHTLETEGLSDRAFLQRYTTGFDRFLPYLLGEADGQPKDADWASAICGIEAGAIRSLARRMAANRTMISVAWSLQRASHGEQPLWMAITLAAMLGQIGLPGGGFGFGYSGANRVGNIELPFSWPALPQFSNPVPDFIPVARLADMLLNPGEPFDYDGKRYSYPDIKLVWWAGGNPFHHQQDLNKLVRAWRKPEVVIVQEPWWNATARHADIVLPCTTTVERNDLGIAKSEPHLFAMRRVVEPAGQARNDYEILSDIAGHLGLRDAFTEGRDEMAWVRHLYDASCRTAADYGHNLPDFETFWEAGEFRFENDAPPKSLLEEFRADPEGAPLRTPSGLIEIFSETIAGFGYDDCPGHPVWMEPDEWLGAADAARYPLHLVSNQPRTRLHSQLDNGAVSREAKVAGREPAAFHPADAAARSIRSGDVVRLFNDRGACLAGAVISPDVSRGTVQLATGAWYDPAEPGEDGALDLHGNPNVLTLDRPTSKLAQAPIAHTTLIEAERFADRPADTTAFQPPRILPGGPAKNTITELK